jgi:hypothetical protein
LGLSKKLARTYNDAHDGWERVQEYQRVLEYTAENPNKGSSAVAKALDLPRGRIRSWVDGGSRPDPVRGIQAAEGNGWLNLGWNDRQLAALNVLVAWIFSGGSITTETYGPRFVINEQTRDTIERALDILDVESRTL